MRRESSHRNVKPTWFGVVFAQHMQDPTITSELKALIALAATCPRENWKWSSCWMRSRLNWGPDRWKRVMIEARERKFVAITKVSDGKSIKSEYHWNIDIPKPAPEAECVRAVDFPTNGKLHAKSRTVDSPSDGKPVGRKTPSHNDVVKGNDGVKDNEESKNRKHGVTGVTAISPAGKSTANPARSSRLPIPPECWKRILQHVREELSKIEWRNLKRDRAALRSLWALTPNADEDCVRIICDALDQAASHDNTAEGFSPSQPRFWSETAGRHGRQGLSQWRHTEMPDAGFCSVCSHDQRAVINESLVKKTAPLRKIADQFRLSKTALIRHKQYHLQSEIVAKAAKDADQSEEESAIDFEMEKLRKAEKRADRHHDLKAKLQIARERRALLELKAKIKARSPVAERREAEPASRAEALELAKDILEAEISSGDQRAEIIAWLQGVLDRVVTTFSTTSGLKSSNERELTV